MQDAKKSEGQSRLRSPVTQSSVCRYVEALLRWSGQFSKVDLALRLLVRSFRQFAYSQQPLFNLK